MKRSMKEVASEVAQAHGLTLEEMKQPRRFRNLAHARHEAMWRMRQETVASFGMIARFFNLMDHTTVVHGCAAHEQRQRRFQQSEAA